MDISYYKARLLTKVIQPAEITIYEDWLRNARNPLYLGKDEKYKQINLQFLIQDKDNDSAYTNMSNLVKQLEKSVIKFDDLSFYYDCYIVSKSNENITDGIFTLSVELKSGYAYKPEVTEYANRALTKTINIDGNLIAPCIVEIIPAANLIDLKVTGFGADFTLKNLAVNQKIIVYGEEGIITQNGINKFSEWDGWEFPYLKPGTNILSFSKNLCDISIKYKPRWI